MLRPYRRILCTPGLPVPLLASFFGALPIGMLELSVLLYVRLEFDSFALAGTAAGAVGIGNALGIIIQGSVIDRRGQTVVLIPAGLICVSSLFLLVTGALPMLACAFAAGASVPATPSSIRVLMGTLIRDDDLRLTGYALSAIAFTLAAVLSPLLVSLLLIMADPGTAVVATGMLACIAALCFASTAASRQWRPSGPAGPWRPRGLATPGLRTLLSVNLGTGVIAGLTNVAIPAIALAHGSAALAGVCASMTAVGDLIGGVAYGARSWKWPLNRRLVGAQCAAAASGLLVAGGAASIPLLLGALLLTGAIGPARGVTMSALLDDVARQGSVTESYATMVSAGLLGGSGGYAAGGALIGRLDPRVALLIAAAGMGIVALYARLRMRTLEGIADVQRR